MKTRKTILIMCIIIVLIMTIVQAQLVLDIKSAKFSYKPGDILLITANISNPNNYSIDAILEGVLRGPDEKTYPVSLTDYSFTLNPAENKSLILYKIEIKPDFPEGEYSVSSKIRINKQIIISKDLNFYITGTLKDMNIDLKTYEDALYNKEKNIFLLNQNVYIRYTSDVSGVKIEATLIQPNKQKKQITLLAQIKAEQIGTYELEINATKQGYKTIEKTIKFGVIKKQINIPYINFNAVKEENIFETISRNPLLIVGLSVGVLVIGVVIFFIIRKKKR